MPGWYPTNEFLELTKALNEGDLNSINLVLSKKTFTPNEALLTLFNMLQRGAKAIYGDNFTRYVHNDWVWQYKDLSTLEFLLSQGADVNYRNDSGETPLYIALQNGKDASKLIKILLDKGANINSLNKDTPLAPSDGNIIFLNAYSRLPIIHTALETHNVNTIITVINAVENVDARNTHGNTVLAEILEKKCFSFEPLVTNKIVKRLLERGADINYANEDASLTSPLTYAPPHNPGGLIIIGGPYEKSTAILHSIYARSKSNNIDIDTFLMLLNHINNVDVKNSQGETVLQRVLNNRQIDRELQTKYVQLLLENNASILGMTSSDPVVDRLLKIASFTDCIVNGIKTNILASITPNSIENFEVFQSIITSRLAKILSKEITSDSFKGFSHYIENISSALEEKAYALLIEPIKQVFKEVIAKQVNKVNYLLVKNPDSLETYKAGLEKAYSKGWVDLSSYKMVKACINKLEASLNALDELLLPLYFDGVEMSHVKAFEFANFANKEVITSLLNMFKGKISIEKQELLDTCKEKYNSIIEDEELYGVNFNDKFEELYNEIIDTALQIKLIQKEHLDTLKNLSLNKADDDNIGHIDLVKAMLIKILHPEFDVPGGLSTYFLSSDEHINSLEEALKSRDSDLEKTKALLNALQEAALPRDIKDKVNQAIDETIKVRPELVREEAVVTQAQPRSSEESKEEIEDEKALERPKASDNYISEDDDLYTGSPTSNVVELTGQSSQPFGEGI